MKKFIIEAKDMNEHTYQIDEYDTKQQAIGGLKLERAWLAASDMIKITDLGKTSSEPTTPSMAIGRSITSRRNKSFQP